MEENCNFITDFDKYLFNEGTHYEIYNKMGAHLCKINGKSGVHFAVWAPNARAVSVVGDFNDWNEQNGIMRCLGDGIYETFIEGAKVYDNYKYLITAADGSKLYKADPYAFFAEKRPLTASRVADISGFKWSDKEWIKKQEEKDMYILDHGRSIRLLMKMKMVTIHIEKLPKNLQIMLQIWDIHILSLWEYLNIRMMLHGAIR